MAVKKNKDRQDHRFPHRPHDAKHEGLLRVRREDEEAGRGVHVGFGAVRRYVLADGRIGKQKPICSETVKLTNRSTVTTIKLRFLISAIEFSSLEVIEFSVVQFIFGGD